MQSETFRIEGIVPLLMHNGRLANPLDPLVRRIKEVTSKKKKTEEDYQQIFRLEWEGSLYHDAETGPYIPGLNIEACLKEGAKLQRRGRDVSRGLFVAEDKCRVKYKGPRDIEALWEDTQFRYICPVTVNQKKTMRCRPVFGEWSVTFTAAYDDEVFNLSDLHKIVEDSGRWVGLGDWHPRFGRFVAGGNGK